MTSGDGDFGLLAPVYAGTPAAAATSDVAWVRAMLDAEAALARAQARLGLIEPAHAAAVSEAANAMAPDPAELACAARGGGNPVIPLVRELTQAVAVRSAAAAECVHLGATSQDIMDTAAMLVASRVLRLLLADLARVAASLAEQADAHRGTVMVARTLTQHAVPTTFGRKCAGWLDPVLDARDGVRGILADGLPVQLGGAAGTLASMEEYRRRAGAPGSVVDVLASFAAELLLAEPRLPWHTARTPIAGLAGALSIAGGALGKIALDVETLSRPEIGELAEPVGHGRGGSSTMPHKRNPVLSTLIVSAARQLPSCTQLLTQSMVAEDERPAGAWHAEWRPLREALRLAGGAAHTAVALAGGLSVFPQRMVANLALTGGQVMAERLSVVFGAMLGRDTAKDVLGEASRRAARDGRSLREVLRELPELAGKYTAAELTELLDPAGYLGASDELIDRVLTRWQDGRREGEDG
ncbi:MAG: 3-carboxy-cis,cis-muconate cycloisomerase [Sciscionella sp.]